MTASSWPTRRRLIWLPWHQGSPPLSIGARIELGCLLRRLERGQLFDLPRTRQLRGIGRSVYESRIKDRPVGWCITYRLDPDVIIVVEVLPDRAEYKENLSPIFKRLFNYRAWETEPGLPEWWQTGAIDEFLDLTPGQVALIDLRMGLAREVRRARWTRDWTQADLARRIKSSQARVAKMEVPESTVSLDFMITSLLTIEVSPARLAEVLIESALSAPSGRQLGDTAGAAVSGAGDVIPG